MNPPPLALPLQTVVSPVIKATQDFFSAQIKIPLDSPSPGQDRQKALQLRDLTAFVAVGGEVNVIVGFSFDRALIDAVSAKFTEDIDVPADEKDVYLNDTASEVLNTIIGVAISHIGCRRMLKMSPPLLVNGGQSIRRSEGALFVSITLTAPIGAMDVIFSAAKDDQTDQLSPTTFSLED